MRRDSCCRHIHEWSGDLFYICHSNTYSAAFLVRPHTAKSITNQALFLIEKGPEMSNNTWDFYAEQKMGYILESTVEFFSNGI